jgi:Ser/Thr protein kinase RdoA (MazF antagonist)
MKNRIRDIHWIEKSKLVDSLFDQSATLTVVPMNSGLEAEVEKISIPEFCAVLKVWNRTSKPNVELQYKLLDTLHSRGLPVSQPLGWGFDKEMNPVLLTSFDGFPVVKVNPSLLTTLTKLLTEIHRFPVKEFDPALLRKHDFISYFYPAIGDHHDIKNLLEHLVQNSGMKQDKMIHGDFNLRNVLDAGGKYTIIDWTNVQLGDPRYDIAWSVVLMRIYVGQRYGSLYLRSFLSEEPYTMEELELYEAIACLRWILLNRTAELPKGKDTFKRVKNILKSNKYLNEYLLNSM